MNGMLDREMIDLQGEQEKRPIIYLERGIKYVNEQLNLKELFE